MSYGIVCDKLYDPEKHIMEPVRVDPRDKNAYVMDQIDWLVVQVKLQFSIRIYSVSKGTLSKI